MISQQEYISLSSKNFLEGNKNQSKVNNVNNFLVNNNSSSVNIDMTASLNFNEICVEERKRKT